MPPWRRASAAPLVNDHDWEPGMLRRPRCVAVREDHGDVAWDLLGFYPPQRRPMSVPPPPSNSTSFSDATRWTAWTFASVGITTTSPNARVTSKIMPKAFARSLSLILREVSAMITMRGTLVEVPRKHDPLLRELSRPSARRILECPLTVGDLVGGGLGHPRFRSATQTISARAESVSAALLPACRPASAHPRHPRRG